VKKLAIFVEGKTEQIFVAKLLREIAGKFQISIEIILKTSKIWTFL
jgi:predicted ATP-dependent endonuclease of OLD family